MLEPMQPYTWERIALLLGIGGILFAGSIYFNNWINKQAEQNPKGPGSGIYVVFGTGYTLAGAFLALWLLFGLESAVAHMLVVFFCFGLAGAPMVIGAISRNNRKEVKTTIRAEDRQRESEIEEML